MTGAFKSQERTTGFETGVFGFIPKCREQEGDVPVSYLHSENTH